MKMKSTLYIAFLTLLSSDFCLWGMEKKFSPQDADLVNKALSTTPTQVGVAPLKNFFEKNYESLKFRNQTSANKEELSRTALFNKSLNTYILEIYNNENYADHLSRDGTHFVEFLRIGNELSLDIESMYTCQRLLFNKIKSCEIIDDTVVHQILTPLATLVEPYFAPEIQQEADFNFLIKEIDALILRKFTDHLPRFEQAPDAFITEIATEIVNSTKHKMPPSLAKDGHAEMVERFRFLIKQTVELLIQKMMWDPHAYQSIKPSFISIGNSILQLAERKVLNHMDDVDDLLTSLTTRLCFFLKVYGSVIPVPAIEELTQSITNQEIFFLELGEQDPGIISKKEMLLRCFTQAKIKSIARIKGLQSDQII